MSLGGVDLVALSAAHLPGLSKEGRQFVEILLFPVVEGMVVALCTTDAHSQEDLRSGGCEFHGIGIVSQDVANRRVGTGFARGPDKFPDHDVVGFALLDRLVDVGEELVAARHIGTDAQHVCQEDGPAIGKAGMLAQLLDQFAPTVLSPAFVERHLLHGWNTADEVEGGPAQEGPVADHRSGDDVLPEVFPAEDVIEHAGGLHHGSGSISGHGHPYDGSGISLGQGDVLRPLRTGLDPGGEQVEFVLLEGLALVRHEALVDRAQVRAPDDFALPGFAGDDGLALRAALQHEGMSFHPQIALGLALFVATNAVGLQDGLDVAYEIGRGVYLQWKERKEEDAEGLQGVRLHQNSL